MRLQLSSSFIPKDVTARRTAIGAIALLMLLGFADRALGDPITDVSFFSSIPHASIIFNTNGAGQSVSLSPTRNRLMPADEYITLGVRFNPFVSNAGAAWSYDGSPDFQAALRAGGSAPISLIPRGDAAIFDVVFTNPVSAFGFFVVDNNTHSAIPTFTALDANGVPIESVTFSSAFTQGTIGIASYGFMDISSSGNLITTARVMSGPFGFTLDDLRFSSATQQVTPVPEPASVLLLGTGLVAIGAMLRKRRKKS